MYKYMIVLEPRRLENRLIKLHQQNKRLLIENEILNIGYLDIDESWDFDLDSSLIKCKKIIGNIELQLNHIPSWMKGIEIDGYFICSYCNLTSLNNCPKIINRSFWCSFNKLTNLDDGPTFVGKNYYCYDNKSKFTKKYVTSICKVGDLIRVW